MSPPPHLSHPPQILPKCNALRPTTLRHILTRNPVLDLPQRGGMTAEEGAEGEGEDIARDLDHLQA